MIAKNPAAPGQLETVRRFVNTLDIESGGDSLDTPEALVLWLREQGLAGEGVTAGPEDLATAIALRRALRALLASNHDRTVDRQAIEAFHHHAAVMPLFLRLDESGTATLEPAAADVRGALTRLLAIVWRATVDGTWRRLKVCRSDACQWAFYDHSKNRSGHWCSMAVCGNRTKVRAYQARRRARQE